MAEIVIQSQDGKEFGKFCIRPEHGWGEQFMSQSKTMIQAIELALEHDLNHEYRARFHKD